VTWILWAALLVFSVWCGRPSIARMAYNGAATLFVLIFTFLFLRWVVDAMFYVVDSGRVAAVMAPILLILLSLFYEGLTDDSKQRN